jgi:mRNA interferase RelE/StbE
MIVEFNKKFDKDISKLDKKLIIRIFEKITEIKKSSDLKNILWIRKMVWYEIFYRVRVWNYRIWLKIKDSKVILERFKHRKDIYDYFPK